MSKATRAPSIAITSLSIRNFRGVEQLDLDFRGPDGKPNSLVVLAGPNGCGKTAVLEAALILAGGTRWITGPRGRQAVRRGAATYENRADFQQGSKTFRTKDLPSLPNGPIPPSPILHWYFPSSRVATLVGAINPTVAQNGPSAAEADQNRLRIVKQVLVDAATVERFENPPPSRRHYSAAIGKINDAWRAFYPAAKQAFAVEIVSRRKDALRGFDVYYCDPEGLRLEVDMLGSGQLELFLFLSTLALSEDRDGIIFIDEPELHLDPQWHRLILRSLMQLQPRAQLFVATHSPEVYDAAASYERHFLVPEDDPRSWLWAQQQTVEPGVLRTVARTHDAGLATLYRAPINLWVEDEVTRTYLSELWNDPAAVRLLIGGGNDGVTAILKDAEESGFTNVFGLIDRDFRRSNKPEWLAAKKTFRRFVLPVHEIENYLLDARALAASRLNNLHKAENDIEKMMRDMASRLCWWAACRDVVAELRRRFRDDFLSDPRFPPVDSETAARTHIRDSPWFKRLSQELTRSTASHVHQLLARSHRAAEQSLADGSWKNEFAGKEILRDVGSRICDRPRLTNYKPSPAEFDRDLAREIGIWQRQNGTVPADLGDLLEALQQRIARRPSRS